jgi:hypothetical protein
MEYVGKEDAGLSPSLLFSERLALRLPHPEEAPTGRCAGGLGLELHELSDVLAIHAAGRGNRARAYTGPRPTLARVEDLEILVRHDIRLLGSRGWAPEGSENQAASPVLERDLTQPSFAGKSRC